MGWYFRKSKSFGPFRTSISKSGISFSAGVKGARMSFGSRGTYVNVGGNGLYYRKKIGKANKKSSHNVSCSKRTNDYTPITDAIQVQNSTDYISSTNQSILKDIKRSRILRWLWIATTIILMLEIDWWIAIIMIALRLLLFRFFRAEINYELDPKTMHEWEKFTVFFSTIKSSKRLWIVETAQNVFNTKNNAGAGRNITRSAVKFKQIKANRQTGVGVFSNAPAFKLQSQKCTIVFLPCEVVIKKGLRMFVCSYDDLNISTGVMNFVETKIVPKDATVINYTWQHVNKSGTADRRYTNNHQIPVCQYGRIVLSANNNLNIEIHISNASAVSNIESAFQYYTNHLEKIKLDKGVKQVVDVNDDDDNDNDNDNGNLGCEQSLLPNLDNDPYSELFDDVGTSQNDLADEMMLFLKED